MSENCSHDCSDCGSSCSSRTQPQSLLAAPHAGTHVKHVIAVVSGKGGVGKSLVTSLMAVQMQRRGFKTAILDADITGPSIPKAFGITSHATGDEKGIFPVATKTGIEIMSMNLLLEDAAAPVVWRGPVISGAVKQFWTDVIWGDIDYMFVDMPPGTGDVPLTVFQSLPVDGILVITSPQELVSMIVEKALKMSEIMHVPVLGLVENMSYFECPDCHSKHEIFGPSHVEESAVKYEIPHTAKLPMDPKFAYHCDKGDIESFPADYLNDTAAYLEGIFGKGK
ncbi:ATP-binding protein [Megasphaera cerevisiae DSM 20462]|uniref:Iron-sulfur cluster carrier protein n=1 Tax=Megasphaera cerevisiae DSM 20462 TaxID=1122219 RepID=A0A0J6WZ76_9FIRM|nr:Mrp/NBP35 family ATP-binding protein [Megasphaera cerevisiae]KMO87533.1 ATP-binding protein [Megasphaera cerevisiae DSM 20462]OKY54283.1 ATP-binding protein [Megasphaera cerevisiae]SJZ52894.1 Chromosome partitioning ATPase, Mrp family, contains Fe-S cluster [Megasphaera cerevisiae DSM 20462]